MNNQMVLRTISLLVIVIGVFSFFGLAQDYSLAIALLAVFSSIVFGSLVWGFSIVIDLLHKILDESIETRRKLEEQWNESKNEKKINEQLPSL